MPLRGSNQATASNTPLFETADTDLAPRASPGRSSCRKESTGTRGPFSVSLSSSIKTRRSGKAVIQSIADTAWRLARIPGLEMAIYAKGRIQFAESFNDHDLSLRPAMIELQTHLTYEKQLHNMQLQEPRLHRRKEKDTAELRRLQEERRREIKQRQLEALYAAVRQYVLDKEDKKPFNPIEHGFEFSMHEIKDHLGSKSAFWIQSVIAARDHRRALQAANIKAA